MLQPRVLQAHSVRALIRLCDTISGMSMTTLCSALCFDKYGHCTLYITHAYSEAQCVAHIAKADELLMLMTVVDLMWNARSLTGL